MLWITLLDKIMRQPLGITAHKFVTVTINGEELEVKGIKFKEDGSFSLTI